MKASIKPLASQTTHTILRSQTLYSLQVIGYNNFLIKNNGNQVIRG